MATPDYTVNVDASNFLSVNRDTGKVILGRNNFKNFDYTNPTGVEVTLEAGTVMGRISATGLVLPLASAAADGSETPIGILAGTFTVAIAGSQNLPIAISGNVEATRLVFDGADTLATVIGGRRLDDRIEGDTMGINLITSTQLSGYDN